MAPIGLALVAIGIIAIIVGIIQRMKAGRVTDAPLVSTGDAASRGLSLAGPKGQISAQGGVMVQQPLYSPVTGTPCLFYELKVTAEWKDGDTTKTKELEHQKVAAQLAINDGSGAVWVDLREGGDFEPMQNKDMEQNTGLLKGIVGGELMFGNYRLNAGIGSLGTTYKVEEKVLPMQQQLYVCGRMAEQGGVITSPKWRNLIVSNKTRDQLLAAATKTAKIALIAGAATFVVGGVLAGVGAATSSDDGGDTASAEPSASAPAPSASSTEDPAAAASATDAPSAGAAPAKKPGTTKAAAATPASGAATTTAAPATTTAAAATTTAAGTTAGARPTSTPPTKPSTTATAKKPTILVKPKK